MTLDLSEHQLLDRWVLSAVEDKLSPSLSSLGSVAGDKLSKRFKTPADDDEQLRPCGRFTLRFLMSKREAAAASDPETSGTNRTENCKLHLSVDSFWSKL